MTSRGSFPLRVLGGRCMLRREMRSKGGVSLLKGDFTCMSKGKQK